MSAAPIQLSDERRATLNRKLGSQPMIPATEAGALIYGLGVRGSRAAIRRGDLPSVRIGRKVFCPTAPLRRLLGMDEPKAPISI